MFGIHPSKLLSQANALQRSLGSTLDSSLGGVVEKIHPGRKKRRVWVSDGRAHIEVRAVHRPGHEEMADHVEKALQQVQGVDWAEVNSVVGRVVVVFDPDEGPSLDELVDIVDDVEEAHGVKDERFPHDKPDHPGDSEPVMNAAIALGADILGLGISVAEQALNLMPIPAEIPTIVSFAENQPRVRRFFERHIGVPATDLGLGLTNAVAQAAAQGPLGIVVDMTHRVNALGELQSERAAWERREEELHQAPNDESNEPVVQLPRSTPLPSGPIETYSDAAGVASLAVFGTVLGVTMSPRRASSAITAGLPKAARQGREAFAAHLGRVLAQRDTVIMDRAVLRRLDRIDTVVLDAEILLTGRLLMAEVVALSTVDESHLFRRASVVFRPGHPLKLHRKGSLTIGPLSNLGRAGIPVDGKQTLAAARALGRKHAAVIGIARREELIGLAGLNVELDPLAEQLAALARQSSLDVVLAGGRSWLARHLEIERKMPGQKNLAATIRTLQHEGHGVALIASGTAQNALHAADCGIGIESENQALPWSADFMTGKGLAVPYFMIEAISIARDVSKRSAGFAAAGSSIGGLWAMLGPAAGASQRAAIPVNAAAFASQVQGIASAAVLARSPTVVPRQHTPWHTMDTDAVLAALRSSRKGLSMVEVGNRTTARRGAPHPVVRLAEAIGAELMNPLTPVLAVGAGLAAAVGSVTDAGLVAGVTVANALIGGVQRVRAEVSIENLLELSTTLVTVRRGNITMSVDRDKLVRGDIIQLKSGDIVPADCRILELVDCEVDESILTGESYPVIKQTAAVAGGSVADRTCMIYEGTTISSGNATAVIVAVGDETEIGQSLANAPTPPPSGVEARLNTLTKYTVPATVASGAVVTGLSMLRRVPMQRAVSSGVSLMVAAVPEGLPLLATVSQLAAAHRLSKRGALVRNPRTIEALGRVDTLCFDKTGTLTLGEISIQRVSDGDVEEHLDLLTAKREAVLAAARRASPVPDSTGSKHLSHATDRAVVSGAELVNVQLDNGIPGWKTFDELAFDPARGYHAVIGGTDDELWISVKGAPETILPRCSTWLSPNGSVSIGRKQEKLLEQEVERLAQQGLRVLAVAERRATKRIDIVDERVQGMELLGFLGLADSVRPTAADALQDLLAAGVQVVMITGDHPSTARAIAKELDILNHHRVVTGPELDAMDDETLALTIPDISVFARVTPTHKVRIVGAYQSIGRVVAMTGDGANDAPAIRLANTGIALGGRGSTAAREAADLVVVDDRIETILEAIIEGRGMWVSVRDALGILVGGNLGEVGFTLATTAISGESPLDARQLLLVNLLTDMLPAMTIALRPPANETPDMLLHEGPDASLGAELVRQIAFRATMTASGATGAWMVARMTGTTRHANTVALAALVGAQLGQTAAIGGTSPIVLASTLASAAALFGIVQTPVVSQFFGCRPLGPIGWSIVAGSTIATTGASIILPWSARQFMNYRESQSYPTPVLRIVPDREDLEDLTSIYDE